MPIIRRLVVPLASLVAVAGMAVAPSSAWAAGPSIHGSNGIRPDSLTTCAGGRYATICFGVTGNGSYVAVFSDSVSWNGTYKDTHLQILGPTGGINYNKNSATGTNKESFSTESNKNVTPGQYCGIAWRESGGTFYDEAESCVTVDS